MICGDFCEDWERCEMSKTPAAGSIWWSLSRGRDSTSAKLQAALLGALQIEEMKIAALLGLESLGSFAFHWGVAQAEFVTLEFDNAFGLHAGAEGAFGD